MTTPRKYQYQRRVTEEKFDGVEVLQGDTGAAPVIRPVVVIGDPDNSSHVSLTGGGLNVADDKARSAAGTLEAIYEQNERILMMLESVAE